MTIRDNDFQVLTATTPNNKEIPNDNPTHSCNNATSGGKDGSGSVVSRDTIINVDAMYTYHQIRVPILTLLNSGASNHCFTDRALFSTYLPLEILSTGLGANLGSTFHIVGKESVSFKSMIDGKIRQVDLNKVLHMPNLRSNLISVLKLGEKGTDVSFDNNSAAVITRDSTKILIATRVGQLYTIDTMNRKLNLFAMETQGSVVSFDTWHR